MTRKDPFFFKEKLFKTAINKCNLFLNRGHSNKPFTQVFLIIQLVKNIIILDVIKQTPHPKWKWSNAPKSSLLASFGTYEGNGGFTVQNHLKKRKWGRGYDHIAMSHIATQTCCKVTKKVSYDFSALYLYITLEQNLKMCEENLLSAWLLTYSYTPNFEHKWYCP